MVIRDGVVLHSEGYGLANLGDGSRLEPSTPVRLGSMTKAFTAMAIVLLEESGTVSFDSPVTDWVPELARFDGITIRHLLNHTSGLPDYYSDSPLEGLGTAPGRDSVLANAEAVSVYQAWGEPLFAPGDRYEYSNPGYEILGLIVERASGMSFGQFLDARIFTPLGMSTAVVRERPTTVIPGRAIGYAPVEETGDWRENDDHWGNWLVGAGGVYASLNDLYLWDQALYDWAETTDRLTESFKPAALNDGTQSPYGFGWSLSDRLDHPAIHHTGSWVGFRTAILRFTDERLTVIVVSNASGPAGPLADSVATRFLGSA
jgi:CubicO group peptidase (beta-lactamase class C family)